MLSLFCTLILSFTSFNSPSKSGEGLSPTVVINLREKNCSGSSWKQAEHFLISEFRTLGFSIKKLHATHCSKSTAKTELLENTEMNRAVCGVMVSFEKEVAVIEIWLHDSKTGRKRYHSFEYSGIRSNKSAQTVALKSVERFRATLISLAIIAKAENAVREKAAKEKTAKEKVAKEKAALKVSEIKNGKVLPDKKPAEVSLKKQNETLKSKNTGKNNRKITAFLSLGPGIRLSPGGTPPAGQFAAAAGISHISGFGGLLDVSSSFVSGELESSDAHSDFNIFRISIWGIYKLFKYNELVFSVGVGSGFVRVYTNSVDEISGKTKNAHAKVGYFGGKSDLSMKITEYLSIYGSFKAGLFLPRIDMYFRGEKKASAGLPELELSAGMTFFYDF